MEKKLAVLFVSRSIQVVELMMTQSSDRATQGKSLDNFLLVRSSDNRCISLMKLCSYDL